MWKNGELELNTGRFRPSLGLLLEAAMMRAATERLTQISETDLLLALLTQDSNVAPLANLPEAERKSFFNAATLLTNYLATDVKKTNCIAAFTTLSCSGDDVLNPFLFESFCVPLGSLLNELPDGADLSDLILSLFSRRGELANGELLGELFRADDLLTAMRHQTDAAPLFDPETGALAGDAYQPRVWSAIEKALDLASHAGEAVVLPVYLLAAACSLRDSYTFLLFRQGGAVFSSAQISAYLRNTYYADQPKRSQLPKEKRSFSAEAVEVLLAAQARANCVGRCRIGERELICELLNRTDAKLQYFVSGVLRVDPAYCARLCEELDEPETIEAVLPLELGECENFSAIKRELVIRDNILDPVVKVLFRKTARNVLLYGDAGTGRTGFAMALAAALREGRFASLRQLQVIWVDLSGVAKEDYERIAQKALRVFSEEPDRLYVVEGFSKYWKEHFSEVTRTLQKNEYRLMLIVDTVDYNELAAMGETLTRCTEAICLPEPGSAETQKMVELALPDLEKEYGVTFAKDVPLAAYRMANDYLLSKRFPKKVIELLEQTAADVVAEAEMRAMPNALVTRDHLAARMSAQTGLPAETILGTGADKDYSFLLSQRLFGQEAAVGMVAGRLDLIQKGMVDKKAPAAVFIFAGLSGTGKTEMAKQIAQIYSSSRKLITFEMASFGEAHSVSRLIGTPPGYVGYEEGGKLINDLNHNPYSVVLLDEIEKAHPAVWDPFLNLFDEGVVTDMRGVTASGSKAFFVLTSNIGQYEIARMIREGRSQDEIVQVVKGKFDTEIHEKAKVPCFRQEFIGRITRRGGIVVFNALSKQALEGIARQMFAKTAREYGDVHDGRLICDDDVLAMLATRVFESNEQAIRRGSGYYGGRELDILMNQYVDNKIASQLRHLTGVPLVRIVKQGNDTAVVPVQNEADAATLLAERHRALADRVAKQFDRIATFPPAALTGLSDERLARMNALLSEMDIVI